MIPGIVPRGELTVLAGLPGLGKSLLTCRWAADLSKKYCSTLLVSIEDSPSHTIWWRLAAAEAKLDHIFHPLVYPVFDGNGALSSFEQLLDALYPPPELVVLDPFTGMLDAKSSSWSDQHVRLVLAPLATLAGERDLAIVYILHLNKAQAGDPLARIGGSVGLAAGPRSVVMFGQDPDDPAGPRSSLRLLAHVKCNVAQLAETQIWHVAPILVEHEGRQVRTARLDYAGVSELDAHSLIRARVDSEEKSERDQAVEIIRQQLCTGPIPSADLEHAVREAGISPRTYDRARMEVGVRGFQQGRKWYSQIVTSQNANTQDAMAPWRSDEPHSQAEEFPF